MADAATDRPSRWTTMTRNLTASGTLMAMLSTLSCGGSEMDFGSGGSIAGSAGSTSASGNTSASGSTTASGSTSASGGGAGVGSSGTAGGGSGGVSMGVGGASGGLDAGNVGAGGTTGTGGATGDASGDVPGDVSADTYFDRSGDAGAGAAPDSDAERPTDAAPDLASSDATTSDASAPTDEDNGARDVGSAPTDEAVDDGTGADATPEAASDAGAPLLVNDSYGTFQSWVCQLVTRPFRVTNAGDGPTGPLLVTLSGSTTFSLGRDDCTGVALAPGASCLMEADFMSEVPTLGIAYSGTIEFVGNPGNMTFFLQGDAQLSSHLSVPSGGYGSVAVGDASPIEKLYIYPSPFTTLLGTFVSLYGDRDDFEITDDTCLAGIREPDGSCYVAVRFRPKSVGAKNVTLDVIGRFGCGTHFYDAHDQGTLSGTGTEPPDGGAESDAAGDAGP